MYNQELSKEIYKELPKFVNTKIEDLVSHANSFLVCCYSLFSQGICSLVEKENSKIIIEVYSKKTFDYIWVLSEGLLLTDDENNNVSLEENALLKLTEGKAHGSYVKIYCTLDPDKKFEIYVTDFERFYYKDNILMY